jgi:PhnB protein
MASDTSIAPWLSVHDAATALDFYKAAFAAVERYRLEDDAGAVMVAQLAIGGADFWVQQDPDARPLADGGPIRLIMTVENPDGVFQQAIAAGATPIAEVHEEHGWRTGRIADPFGHHWELARVL